MREQVKRMTAILTAVLMAVCLPAAGPAFAAAEKEEVSSEIEELVSARDDEGREVPLEQIDERDYDGFICVLERDADQGQINEMRDQIDEIDDPSVAEEISPKEVVRAESLEVVEEIAEPEAIDYIEPDYVLQPDAATVYYSDPGDYLNESTLSRVGVRAAWSAGITGRGQNGKRTPIIAIMDTGLIGASTKSMRHEDLDYSKIPYYMKSSTYSSYNDSVGHGTFVAGEIAAVMGNGKGISGLMPDARIVPVKVIGPKGGKVSDAIAALKALTKKGGIDVVNMSFGAPYYSSAFSSACKKAAAKGMILVAAAGNDGSSGYMYPAAYDSVVGVAAVTESGSRWKRSQHNDAVDIAAPGVSIVGLSHKGPHSYAQMSGSSMAAPMVSALAAMVKSIDPSVSHNRFQKILKATATDKGKKGYDNYYGWGIINFGKAYTYMKGSGYAASKKGTKAAKPARAKIRSASGKKTKIKLRIKKAKRATSYQIAIKVKGGKYYRIRTIKRKCTITGLQRGRQYVIKVRGVRNVNGVNFYGKWSKVKKVRTK